MDSVCFKYDEAVHAAGLIHVFISPEGDIAERAP
jgi:hypothetical protein